QSERDMHVLNKQALQYSTLEREVNSSQELYNLLLSKMKEAEVTRQIRTPMVQVIEPARIPDSPVRPKKTLNVAVGLVLGGMFGTVWAFLREYLQGAIRTPKDVTTQLQLPVLGVIPRGKRIMRGYKG